MRTIHIYMLWLCLFSLFGIPAMAQNNSCGPEDIPDPDGYMGTVFFNYGSGIRAKSNTFKTAVVVGQNFIGQTESLQQSSALGFYSRYLLPPFALKVRATQGEVLDRILVTWEIDELGPYPNDGFFIDRDGSYHAEVDSDVRSFSDFDVIAGRSYKYTVRGKNLFGLGSPSDAIGFQVPNGVVTGWISTGSGKPVTGASVTLMPMQGFSAKFEAGNGAFTMTDSSSTPFLPELDQDWTMAFWIKTDTAFNDSKLIEFQSRSLYFRPRPNGEGIAIATTPNGPAFLAYSHLIATRHDWHHVALTYDRNGNKGRLYIDGVLKQTAAMTPVESPDSINFGSLAGSGTWKGRLDEVRIYHHRLDELDFDQVMESTASSSTPHLTHYWKFDEERGTKSFDIVKREKMYFCGANFDADRPPVHTGAMTDEDGYYRIESASYGDGITFLATAKKNFYMHRALKFERTESDSATIPDFAMTPKATIELWVNNAAPSGFQCILSKKISGQEFRVVLDDTPNGLDNNINVHFNGTTRVYGTLGPDAGYHHLAITIDGTGASHKINVYKDGILVGIPDNTFPLLNNNWSNPANPWHLGNQASTSTNYFDGLIDEFAVYDTILIADTIMNHFGSTRNIQDKHLRAYFPFDEGSGTRISNVGYAFLDGGTTNGTEWSPLAAHQVVEPHDFQPDDRQVTLNPSVTSVDQVDFQDLSIIAVSGYVRYKNTNCFAKDIEILVNGESANPPVMTDSTGQFIVDFDPGTSATFTPKFENHVFSPASWEVMNVSNPITGIIFNDLTTRKISGRIVGGECKKSIIRVTGNSPTYCLIEVRSYDGCYVRDTVVDNAAGNYTFLDLPAIDQFIVGITDFSDPAIKDYFDVQGSKIVDLSRRDTTMLNFTYRSQPQIIISNRAELVIPPPCDLFVMEQGVPLTLEIKLIEQYLPNNVNGQCPIDTANFHIVNGFGDEIIDTTMGGGLLEYTFQVGEPNPVAPYLKTLQIVSSTIDGNDGEYTEQGIVTGFRPKDNVYTTVLPETPILILHDPPGDGSYAYLEKNEKVCQKLSFTKEFVNAEGATGVLDLGPDLDIGSFWFLPDFELVTEIGLTTLLLTTHSKVDDNSIEVCNSFSERISTSEDDLIVGGYQGGDVYVGGGLNVEFGFANHIMFDTMHCLGTDTVTLMVVPGNYATTYMYSEYGIESLELVYLDSLYNHAVNNNDLEQAELYMNSIEAWEEIILDNQHQKDSATFVRNISFDAGASYEYSQTSDTSIVSSTAFSTTIETNVDFNALAFGGGIGGGVIIHTNFANITGDIQEDGTEKGITTGYVLKDDDVLDAFTIDVGMDRVYKTPTFKIKAGQTSCPWEYPTAKREGVQLISVDGPVRTDVPSHEPAVYHFLLTNISATNETWTYAFTAGPESNPDGAEIFCNGAPMNQIQWYAIPWGETVPVTVTLERGPVEYDYDELEIVLYSACEDQRANDLGILPDTALHLYSAVYVSAHFLRPCSEVDINSPRQDWVVFADPSTPNSGPNAVDDNYLRITTSGYNFSDTLFKEIKLQWREKGAGSWNPLTPDTTARYNPNYKFLANEPLPRPLLDTNFTQFYWQTFGLPDGEYDIRAVAVCVGDAAETPGYSDVIKGRIDRDPPKLLGFPQPSDGVLHNGDEISATFNQPINCGDVMQNVASRVKLFNDETGATIGKQVTCGNDKIVIVPTGGNALLENSRLRAELHNIEDLVGNKMTLAQWEFYVDRNEIAWLVDSAGITKYEDETKSINVKIHNRAGFPVPFSIEDVPDWLHVSPDGGTLVANEIRDLQFTVADTMELGWFTEAITLHADDIPGNPFFIGGDESLPIGVRNICRPPDWEVDPSLFQLTMTMNLRIRIDSLFSFDPEDQVAIFIGGQLRGSAKPSLVPSTGNYVAFVTVYGNTSDINKPLTYEIFDASACLHYAGTIVGTGVNFAANAVVGAPNNARIISTTNGLLLHDIPLNKGWNWISFNLAFADPVINQALKNIPNPANDLIKNQTQFASNTNGLWTGSLTTLNNTSAYQYEANQPNTLKISGNGLNPATTPIPVSMGWNWIGYIPNYSLPVTTALGSLNPTSGDIIKGQTTFAQYLNPAAGWVGSLKTMKPREGYLLYLTTAGTITYPPQPFTGDQPTGSRNEEAVFTYWNVDATQFEHNMTLTGYFEYNGINATTGDMELGVFAGGEIRGVGEAIYVEALNAHLFFMTCFANTSGEQLQFKLYDWTTGEIQTLDEKMFFIPNQNEGSITSPVPFHLHTTAVNDVFGELSFNVQPNPFRDETTCFIELPDAQLVGLIVYDVDGKNLYSTQIQANAGMNTFIWKGCSTNGTPLGKGIYFMRIETVQGVLTKKVVLQR